MNDRARVKKIVAAVLIFSTVIIACVPLFLSLQPPEQALDQTLSYILIALASVNILGASKVGQLLATGEGEQAAFTAMIVGYAMREAGAVLGLVLSILSGDVTWALTFGGIACVLGVLEFPKD